MLTIETLKSHAKRLKSHLSAIDVPLTHSQALEAVAVMHGHRDWNTASAAAKHHATPLQASQQPHVLFVTCEESQAELREMADDMLRLKPSAIRFRVDANITIGQVRDARVVSREIEERGVKVEFDAPV